MKIAILYYTTQLLEPTTKYFKLCVRENLNL